MRSKHVSAGKASVSMLVNGQRLNRAYGVGGGLEMAYGGSGAQRVREMFDGRVCIERAC